MDPEALLRRIAANHERRRAINAALRDDNDRAPPFLAPDAVRELFAESDRLRRESDDLFAALLRPDACEDAGEGRTGEGRGSGLSGGGPAPGRS